MYVRVHVYPGMKKEKVTLLDEHTFEMVLKVPAERNLANHRVRELLAEWYNVPGGQIRIVTGHHSPRKVVDVLLA